MWLRKPIHLLYKQKKNIDTVKKTEESQTSKETVVTSKTNKTDSLNTIDKSMSYPRTNQSNKKIHIGKTPEINIDKYNKYVSDLSR